MHGRRASPSRLRKGQSAEERGVGAMLGQPESSWSRRDAAKACVAACVSMAFQRWIKAKWRKMAGAWRAFV